MCAIEPGRSVVGAAGWLVAGVLHSRARSPHAQQVVLDAGMTELIRPALYGEPSRCRRARRPTPPSVAETELV